MIFFKIRHFPPLINKPSLFLSLSLSVYLSFFHFLPPLKGISMFSFLVIASLLIGGTTPGRVAMWWSGSGKKWYVLSAVRLSTIAIDREHFPLEAVYKSGQKEVGKIR